MRAILVVFIALVTLPRVATSAQFTRLGALNGGLLNSSASDLSADGRWVTGAAVLGPDHVEAFVWSRHTGFKPLGDLPTGITYSVAGDISNDGQTVVGQGSARGDYALLDGFIWTASGGMAPLGFLDDKDSPRSYGQGVSGDGQIAVGSGSSHQGNQAFRWTSAGGMQGLGDLPGGAFESYARAISDDGRVIVGSSQSEIALEAFRWTSEGGMQGLGFLPGFVSQTHPNAVNSDGSIIVGSVARQGWRWTESTGMVNLEHLAEFGANSGFSASGLTEDGNIIVGVADPNNAASAVAAIWDQAHGVRNLQKVLEVEHGLVLPGWTLRSASGISSDGNVVIGSGTNPQGISEGWLVNLAIPEPATAWLTMLASITLVNATRRNRSA